jgi:hypothetical protein
MAEIPATDVPPRPRAGRRTFETLAAALAGGAMRSRAYGVISAAILAAAVIPFVGWILPAAWFVVACGLVVGMRAWFERLARAGRASTARSTRSRCSPPRTIRSRRSGWSVATGALPRRWASPSSAS